MQLTKESIRTRWIGLIVVWTVCATLALLHAIEFKGYVERLDRLGLRGAAEAPTPLQRICPTMYADTQMWVRHALALTGGAGPQLRETQVDNAPFGREVHWNSGFAWALAGAGWVRHVTLGEPMPQAIERSLAWFNLPLFLLLIAVMSGWTARRAGLGAGGVLALAMVGHASFYTGFNPNYVDHHGLIAASTLGLFLGGVFMGGGFRRAKVDASQLLPETQQQVRAGALFSAVCGAVGMWVSAASTIPAIVITAGAGVLAIIVHGRGDLEGKVTCQPEAWRLWGRCGAAGSLLLYLMEYAPSHLGMRLEVNHPVHALAWWGGSELLAAFAEWRCARVNPLRGGALRIILAVAAIAVAPVVVALGGQAVFVVFDPFIARLSKHVAEGISLAKAIQIFGFSRMATEAIWAVVTLVVGSLAYITSRRPDRPLLLFSLATFVAFAALGLAQIRWLPSVSGAGVCLLVVALSSIVTRWRPVWRWTAITAIVGALCLYPAVKRVQVQREVVQQRIVDAIDAIQPIYRDVAVALRASQPSGEITLLASPNASTAIAYYGQFRAVGTLYWENLSGTKAAAEMFSAQSESAARRLIRERGVTHLAMISTENFLAEYFNLLHPEPGNKSVQQSFGYLLLVNQQVPLWLDVIPYTMPADVPAKVERALLLKTRFAVPEAETIFERALMAIEGGRLAEGEADVDRALAIAPDSAEFQLIKARLLLTRRDGAALDATVRALDLVPVGRRLSLLTVEAARFYQARAHQEAAALYRRALSIQFDALTANNLAWLLSTSPDDAVRNGREALRLAEQVVAADQSYAYLTAYAAALAECGRFADAITITLRAMELARAAKDMQLVEKSEARLAIYRHGKPLRE